jgi:hypothetical protein
LVCASANIGCAGSSWQSRLLCRPATQVTCMKRTETCHRPSNRCKKQLLRSWNFLRKTHKKNLLFLNSNIVENSLKVIQKHVYNWGLSDLGTPKAIFSKRLELQSREGNVQCWGKLAR